jgi:hypothetical protein
METKTICEELRRFYLEVEDGFIRFQGAPFLPVYMVPVEKKLWADLAEVLLKIVKSIREVSWVDRFRRDLRKIEPGLLEEWRRIFRFTGDEGPAAKARNNGGESVVVAAKLRSLGQHPRRPMMTAATTSNISTFFASLQPGLSATKSPGLVPPLPRGENGDNSTADSAVIAVEIMDVDDAADETIADPAAESYENEDVEHGDVGHF